MEESSKKIKELKEKLEHAKDDGLTVEERQKLRNKASARISRLKKKEELNVLYSLIEDKDSKMDTFVTNILIKRLKKHP